ncbi:DEAD/DEAH box helicase [Rhizobium leguminosarum bv. viciae]|uniref:DEAD/DEAH box helicase n=1 Tax=Rhizobium leguminosarum TaxID=384 RepID=UPI00103CAE39|nr:DEAD/DEAH box helicase [Rhizobium leguminosarum]TBZ35723.1 DEAD/DEAH box helicase [Rhizobium leguminosarum bv. viciae]
MFDPITSAIIASAPALSGLDLDDLPKRLTQAFSEIVAARIELRGQRRDEPPEALVQTIREMQRLASAHESYVALLPDRDNRSAAAFVAASAHQVCLLGTYKPDGYVSYLDGASLSAEVCASLLFLIAEAHADAAECAKRISAPTDPAHAVEAALLNAIRWLCLGRVHLVAAIALPELPIYTESSDTAVSALYLELLKGIKNLALRIQRRADLPTEVGGIEPSANFFNRVKQLSIGQLDDIFGTGDPVFSLFPGPLHLANLLLAVDRDLIGSALSRIPTPDQVPDQDWWRIVKRMSGGRPFLWRNHRDAIDSGYLNKGVSAAISFPTGGGKSTLSELKIATALLREEKVVFLAPTHALVDQTARSLQKTFKTFDFEIFGDVADDSSDGLIELPEAIVTTPERCLMLLTTQPEAFQDLGLVVFDECHLLHPRDAEKSRRSVDAMLALLNLSLVAPNADLLLLSAMMKNTEEIASWVGDLTGRNCLALNLAWKPTRQVRGTVVYAAKRINELNETLTEARASLSNVNAPKAVTDTLTARPFGFFGLLQTWATRDRRDYALLPLLADEHVLSTGTTKKRKTWYLTPNGNHTSTLIAAAAAEADLKTLVFVQSVVLAESAVREFRELDSRPPVTLTEAELDHYRIASEEMGGAGYCYISVDENGNYSGGAAGHHSLLLRDERLLHESLFRRADGLKVLFATSTLAQGMNLPSELVIIAGDSRFDPEKEKLAQLEAHELLNAAGRAGRAGENSQGMVLVVPSKVVEFDEEKGLINAHWMTLQSIFSQSDQCLEIDDPTTVLLDRIQAGTWGDAMSTYFVSRLPPADEDGSDGTLRNVLNKSLAAFKARQRGDEQWIEDRISAVFSARNQIPVAAEDGWLDRVSGLTGVGIESLRQIAAAFEPVETFASTDAAIATLLKWLMADPRRLFEVMRPENVDDFFGVAFGKLSIEEKAGYALPIIWDCLDAWMSGAPLKDIEAKYPNGDSVRCKHARHFVLRMVPDLAFFAGLPARLSAARHTDKGEEEALSIVLSTLGAAVREGCDSPEALAVRMISARRTTSRVAARAEFDLLNAYFPAGSWNETLEKTQERARNAKLIRAFVVS